MTYAPENPYGSMTKPFIASGAFHALIFLLSVLGLPYIVRPTPMPTAPVSIEIVQVDKITQTNRVAKPSPKPVDEKPPPAPEKPQPPKMTAAVPPEAATPLEKPSDVPMPKEKKPDDKKLKPAPKKPLVKTPDKTAKPTEEDFNSLLKNLVDTPQGAQTDTQKNSKASAIQAPTGEKMTMSDLDALNAQFGECWNIMAGAQNAEDIAVEIRLTVRPDRTVENAVIVDQLRYNADSHFRAAAEAALRALRHQSCAVLKLPPEKYNEWKDMIFNFDPRNML